MKYPPILLLCFCMGWLIACGDKLNERDEIDYATIGIYPNNRVASNSSIAISGHYVEFVWMSIGGVEGTSEAIPVLPAPVIFMWHPERELPLGPQSIVVKWQVNGQLIEPDFPPLESPPSIEVIPPDHIPPRLVSSTPIGGGTIAATTTLLHTTFSELIGRIEHASLVSGETVQEFGIYPATCNPELRWVVALQPATNYRLVLQGIYDFAWNRTEEVTVSFHTSD